MTDESGVFSFLPQLNWAIGGLDDLVGKGTEASYLERTGINILVYIPCFIFCS